MSYETYQKDLEVFRKFVLNEKDSYKKSKACFDLYTKYPKYHTQCKCNCCSCFSGDGLVLMVDNTYKKIADLEKNDIVTNGAKIICKIVFKSTNQINLVKYKDLVITPWHPIIVNKKWVFPFDVCDDNDIVSDVVYNFILDSGHVLNVNGVQCVTLGHNFIGEVIGHPYFGSQKIVQDFMNTKGWDDGLITYNNAHVIRDHFGIVSGIVSKIASD